jgi:hypothetical protein
MCTHRADQRDDGLPGTTLVSAVTTEAENDQRCWLTRETNLDPSVKVIHN